MTDPLAPARAALSDPNTPQNLREILEAELGRPEEPDYAACIATLEAAVEYFALVPTAAAKYKACATAIETLIRRCERLDQLWVETLQCAARSMERVRELEEGK